MSQENKTVFEYNGYTFNFDIADADDSEKYEKAIDVMSEDEKSIPKAGKLSEIYRAQCKLIKEFFDNVLGADSGKNICGEKDNVTACYTAYTAFLDFVKAQRDNVLAVRSTIGKYSNREQRRAASKK